MPNGQDQTIRYGKLNIDVTVPRAPYQRPSNGLDQHIDAFLKAHMNYRVYSTAHF